MNNKLIQTDGIWYKIKSYLKNIFFNKKFKMSEEQIRITEPINNNFIFSNVLKEEFEIDNKKQILANKLLFGELGTSELNEQEVNEMTEYFTKDIKNIDNDLIKIKQHILYMQRELKK